MKRTLDATGLSCPLPVLEAKKALREMEVGQLEVVVDNIIALQNLEKMAKQMGLTHELQTIDEDRHTIVINLGDGEAHPRTSRGETVVVLASDQMGSGDPELGRVLMKSFIYALSELEELPARIEALEGTVAELTATMADPDFFRQQSDAITDHNAALADAQRDLDQAYARWEALEGG